MYRFSAILEAMYCYLKDALLGAPKRETGKSADVGAAARQAWAPRFATPTRRIVSEVPRALPPGRGPWWVVAASRFMVEK